MIIKIDPISIGANIKNLFKLINKMFSVIFCVVFIK